MLYALISPSSYLKPQKPRHVGKLKQVGNSDVYFTTRYQFAIFLAVVDLVVKGRQRSVLAIGAGAMLLLDIRSSPILPKDPPCSFERPSDTPVLHRPAPRKPAQLGNKSPASKPDTPEAEGPAAGPSSRSSTPRRPPSSTKRRFECTFDGCDKAYFKPSRLAEHELTHTGEVSCFPDFSKPQLTF